MKQFRPVPSQAFCSRCSELFVYFRKTRPRVLCEPCIPLEAAEANKFYRDFRQAEARRNAVEAHEHA